MNKVKSYVARAAMVAMGLTALSLPAAASVAGVSPASHGIGGTHLDAPATPTPAGTHLGM